MKTEYLAEAAYLVSRGFSQKQITTLLALNKNEVSDLVRRAESLGLLTHPKFSEESFLRLWPHEQDLHAIERLRCETNLLIGLQNGGARNLRRVKIVRSVSGANGWLEPLLDFGQQTAPLVVEILQRSNVCGVGWGGTVAAPISALESRGLTRDGVHPRKLVAIGGELLEMQGFRDSCSSLVERLIAFFESEDKPDSYTLRGMPALLPDGNFRQLYEQIHPGYRAIFKDGLKDQLDTILTSVGTAGQEGVSTFKRALIARWDITETRLKRIAWGDIGGALIPRKKLSAEDQSEFDRISKLWTGINLECYQKTAGQKKGAGTVVLALGKGKAEIIHEAAIYGDGGLINCLIIDLDLSQAVAVRASIDLSAEPQPRTPPNSSAERIQRMIQQLDHLSAAERTVVRTHLLKDR